MSARGQSLVVMALCLLLVVVMAMMTLGIGQRVRERIQLQAMTDATAHSQATLVARAYNEIALSNRGIVGDMVAMAATYSLIDYSSMYVADVTKARTALSSAKDKYDDIVSDCVANALPLANPRCACARAARGDADWGAADAALRRELQRLNRLPLQQLDANATGEANDYRSHAIAMHEHAEVVLDIELSRDVSPYYVAKTYALAGGQLPNEMKAPIANDAISLREVHTALVNKRNGIEHQKFVDVGRGTRYQFVLARSDAGPINARFASILSAAGVQGIRITATRDGTADWVAGDSLLRADDSSTVTVSYNAAGAACGNSSESQASAASITTAAGAHTWPNGADLDPVRHELVACDSTPSCAPPPPPLYDYNQLGTGTEPPTPTCHLPQCVRSEDVGGLPRLTTAAKMAQAMAVALPCDPCPGVWPAYLGWKNSCANNGPDLYCQPKQYAILQRDYAARPSPDPWNLAFRFRFTPAGQAIDLNRLSLADGTNINRQTAVAGGIAYYHYNGGGRWTESPNLLNPFWRATLAPMDVDAQGDFRAPTPGMDIPNFFLQSVNPAAESSRAAGAMSREVFLELMRNGYRGVQ